MSATKSSKIIPFNLNADFFNQRAMKSLDQYNLSKALRYFRRAVELEPDNPDYLFNIAGVLAQLENYTESNEVLQFVLQRPDNDAMLAECHYYLACNYANMNLLEKAEWHVLSYMDCEADGEYAKEAEELLDYICSELERPPSSLSEISNESGYDSDNLTVRHEEARKKMEDGLFKQAAVMLEQMVKENPDFFAGYNNLSLCYYYTGEFAQSLNTIEMVLQRDPANVHALCNLAVLYAHQEETDKLQTLLDRLKKLVPFQYDQTFKLAITLGIMGEHETAFTLFKKMVKFAWSLDFQLFHYCAVSAYNIGQYKQASKYWKLLLAQEPDSYVAAFYLEQVEKQIDPDLEQTIPYYYHLPFYLRKDGPKKIPKAFLAEEVKQDPLMRSSFLWALRYGDRETKMQVLQAFEWLGDTEVVAALEDYVQQTKDDKVLKRMASTILKKLRRTSTDLQKKTVTWRKSWTDVLDLLKVRLPALQLQQAEKGWARFIELQEQHVPVIRKPEAWAAAVEWAIIHKETGTIQELVEHYKVTAKTIQKNAMLIENTLQLT
jgi:tetratricopeptide (TPR) repeat protein